MFHDKKVDVENDTFSFDERLVDSEANDFSGENSFFLAQALTQDMLKNKQRARARQAQERAECKDTILGRLRLPKAAAERRIPHLPVWVTKLLHVFPHAPHRT